MATEERMHAVTELTRQLEERLAVCDDPALRELWDRLQTAKLWERQSGPKRVRGFVEVRLETWVKASAVVALVDMRRQAFAAPSGSRESHVWTYVHTTVGQYAAGWSVEALRSAIGDVDGPRR